MIFPDQTILHAEGTVGNCFQAAIAGVLGWAIEKVPHFVLLGDVHWWTCAYAWLLEEGYELQYGTAPDYLAPEGALPHCILSGPSPRGFHHAVVGDSATGEMAHDPHPSRAGLLQVDYRLFFVPRGAA